MNFKLPLDLLARGIKLAINTGGKKKGVFPLPKVIQLVSHSGGGRIINPGRLSLIHSLDLNDI